MDNVAEYSQETNGRHLSGELWRDADIGNSAFSFAWGVVDGDDFVRPPAGFLTAQAGGTPSGTFGPSPEQSEGHGLARLASGSATAGNGPQVRTGSGSQVVCPLLLKAGRQAFFECRFLVRDAHATNGADLFLGIGTESSVPIAGAGAYGAGSFAGISSIDSRNVGGIVKNGATETAVDLDGGPTLPDDDVFEKWGFRIDGLDRIEFFINGVLVGKKESSGLLNAGPYAVQFLAHARGATTNVDIDWFKAHANK